MKWGPKNRYELPGDPDFITRLFWAIEDYARLTHKETLALVIVALVLFWLVVAYAVPGPH